MVLVCIALMISDFEHLCVCVLAISVSSLEKYRSDPLHILFLINLFIYLFLAMLGLRCCTWDFSSCGEWGLLFVVVCGLLLAVASFVEEHGL